MITFNFPITYKDKEVQYKIGSLTDDPVDLDLQYQINLLNTPIGSIETLPTDFGVPFYIEDLLGKEAYNTILALLAPDINITKSLLEPIR